MEKEVLSGRCREVASRPLQLPSPGLLYNFCFLCILSIESCELHLNIHLEILNSIMMDAYS